MSDKRSPLVCLAVAAALSWSGLVPVMAADKPASQAIKSTAKVDAPLVKVENAWVRPTVKGQTATGGFMTLTATQALTLVGFESAAAGSSELHEMVMEGDVMRMRAIDSLALPAAQAVVLRPGAGGQHLMLMDVKQPLTEGGNVKLTLLLRMADGKSVRQEVMVPVRMGAPMMHGGDGEHDHHHMMGH
jgi:copper(I)-binding protein